MTLTAAPTLIRTRRRPRRDVAPVAPPDTSTLAARVGDALAVNDPPMLAVADEGRGWWPIVTTVDGVTVRRHGVTLTVPWSSVELDG